MYFRNIHFGGGGGVIIIARFHDDGKHWVEIERFLILVIGSVKTLHAPSKPSKEFGRVQSQFFWER